MWLEGLLLMALWKGLIPFKWYKKTQKKQLALENKQIHVLPLESHSNSLLTHKLIHIRKKGFACYIYSYHGKYSMSAQEWTHGKTSGEQAASLLKMPQDSKHKPKKLINRSLVFSKISIFKDFLAILIGNRQRKSWLVELIISKF